MISRLLISMALVLGFNSYVLAQDIYVQKGRIALIDLGTLIKGTAQVSDSNLIKAFSLSGMEDENYKSVVAVQGLKDAGKADLMVSTSSGLHHFSIILNEDKTVDYSLNPSNSRIRNFGDDYTVNKDRASLITLPDYINNKVLVSNPEYLEVSHFLDYYDENYLKVLSVKALKDTEILDLVVPCRAGVMKLSLSVKEGADHVASINLI